ncbi:6-bladed beta-propeller [Chitinophaga sp. CF418]|uniref:6-bladed beta-propeller n=1 Tax=Chitinophaga sp. CF418 TaxID=1855287 RepID=UPI000919541F|nr:6-bladed beta-propeller [Chitinophaga sp. CF418]SHN25224.1 hypothetical protein SAMN05216311_107332 [Chitinophaga sp. CF418]
MTRTNTLTVPRSFFYMILILILPGCNIKEPRKKNNIDFEKAQKITIEDKQLEDHLFLDEIIDRHSLEIYTFQEDKDNMLGMIGKCVSTPEGILIFDSSTKSIYLFDFNGTLIRKIGSYGKGPHEYLKPLDVVYNPFNNTVEVLDMAVKTRKFDIHSGELKFEGYSFQRKYHINSFLPIDSNIYAGYNGFSPVEEVYQNNFRFGVFKEKNIEYRNLYFDKETAVPVTSINPFYLFDNKVRFFESIFPVIYSIDADTLVPEYRLVFKTANPSLTDPDDPALIKEVFDKKLPMLSRINETNNFIFITYLVDEMKRFSIYNKADSKSLGTAIFNYKIKELDLELYSLFQDGAFLGSIVYPDDLMRVKEHLSKLQSLSPLQDRFNKLNISALSNPIFIRFKTI